MEHVKDITLIQYNGSTMANRAFLVAVVMMGAAICGFWGTVFGETKEFPASRQAIVNPLMDYAPPGDSGSPSEGCSLVYIDFTWRELEPEEGALTGRRWR